MMMRLALIGMSGSGKSYWSKKLAQRGFKRFCCDDLIALKLAPELARSDGTPLTLGEWMGFPYEAHYRARESQYLACEIQVLNEILDELAEKRPDCGEAIVVDTTGSVIYTGEAVLRRLQTATTAVLLSTPPQVQEEMLQKYMAKPRPILWQDTFRPKPHETPEAALARCYSMLLKDRERSYEQYAGITLDYYMRRAEGFETDDFLNHIARRLGNS
jgi:shikimate kinase